jgi:hypothetical protein
MEKAPRTAKRDALAVLSVSSFMRDTPAAWSIVK